MRDVFIVILLVFIYLLIRFSPQGTNNIQPVNNNELINTNNNNLIVPKPTLNAREQHELDTRGRYLVEEIRTLVIPVNEEYNQHIKELEKIRSVTPNFNPNKINRVDVYEFSVGSATYYLYKFMDNNGEILIPNNDYVLGYLPCSWINNNNKYIGPAEHKA